MERSPLRLTVAAMLGLVACFAVNFWLFRLGILWGILGLSVSKHIAIAYLCRAAGVDRRRREVEIPQAAAHRPPRIPA